MFATKVKFYQDENLQFHIALWYMFKFFFKWSKTYSFTP